MSNREGGLISGTELRSRIAETLSRRPKMRLAIHHPMLPLNPWPVGSVHLEFVGALPDQCRAGDQLLLRFRIKNDSATALWSTGPNPVHAVALWVPVGEELRGREGLRSRLPGGAASHSSSEFQISTRVPWEPGLRDLALTLVQEGIAWGHDLDPSLACVCTTKIVV